MIARFYCQQILSHPKSCSARCFHNDPLYLIMNEEKRSKTTDVSGCQYSTVEHGGATHIQEPAIPWIPFRHILSTWNTCACCYRPVNQPQSWNHHFFTNKPSMMDYPHNRSNIYPRVQVSCLRCFLCLIPMAHVMLRAAQPGSHDLQILTRLQSSHEDIRQFLKSFAPAKPWLIKSGGCKPSKKY